MGLHMPDEHDDFRSPGTPRTGGLSRRMVILLAIIGILGGLSALAIVTSAEAAIR